MFSHNDQQDSYHWFPFFILTQLMLKTIIAISHCYLSHSVFSFIVTRVNLPKLCTTYYPVQFLILLYIYLMRMPRCWSLFGAIFVVIRFLLGTDMSLTSPPVNTGLTSHSSLWETVPPQSTALSQLTATLHMRLPHRQARTVHRAH